MLGRADPAIAEASARDAGQAAAIHGSAFNRGWSEDEFAQLFSANTSVAHRAMVGETLAGFILSRMAGKEAEILSIAVAGRYRGRGIAGDLLRVNLRRLVGLGVQTVFLEVDEHNDSARRLYARAGFHEVGKRRGYYGATDGRPANALILRRDLVSA